MAGFDEQKRVMNGSLAVEPVTTSLAPLLQSHLEPKSAERDNESWEER